MYHTAEERIAEGAACIASNKLGKTVLFRNLPAIGFLRFYVLGNSDQGSAWPVGTIKTADEYELGAAVALALAPTEGAALV